MTDGRPHVSVELADLGRLACALHVPVAMVMQATHVNFHGSASPVGRLGHSCSWRDACGQSFSQSKGSSDKLARYVSVPADWIEHERGRQEDAPR